jgi:uncharacterized membrane protein YGL010W
MLTIKMACFQYYLVSRINPTASTPRKEATTSYNSRQIHESRRPIYSIVNSFKYSPIKYQSFHFRKPQLIISNRTSINNDSEQNPQEISKKKDMGLLDLEKHFAFYGAYHSNPVNILIHMIFVWPIVFASLMLLYFAPKLPLIGFGGNEFLVFNLGFVLTVIYALYYVALDKKAGSLAGLMCFVCWVSSSYLCNQLGSSLSWKVAVAAQLFCWTGQFLGHGLFEKRAPALLDNLSQAFLMAPFFVLLEALQSFFGYEPYPGFHSRVKAKIDADIKEWHEKKKHKKLT